MRTLVVVRHAKADTPADIDDVDRPLLPRGRKDAAAVGRWLLAQGIAAQLIVASPARRTVETVNAIVTALGDTVPTVIEEKVYEATLGDLLRIVRGLDDAAPVTMLVGHNPGLSELVIELSGEPMVLGTATAVAIELPADAWADVAPASGRVAGVGVGRAR